MLFVLILSIIEISPGGLNQAHATGDFTITAFSSSIGPISTIGEGSTAISVSTGGSGFTGQVNLTDVVTPSTGLRTLQSPTSVTLTSTATSATSTLTVDASAVGTYKVNVTGTSSSLKHFTVVTVTVVSGGLICLANPSIVPPPPANPCPPAPGASLRGLPPITPARQLRVGVYVNGSDSLNTFDITLLADHTILLPVDTSLTGTILGTSPTTLIKCVGGMNKISSGPCPPTDTVDTIHFSASGSLTTTPAIGLLFTAIYNVTGSTTTAGIPIGFQIGCTNTGIPNTCVKIGNGTPVPVAERIQGGTFFNAPDFGISIVNSVTFTATLGGSPILTATSLSQFAGTVNLSATSNSTNLTASLSPSSVTLTSGGSKPSTLQLASSTPGNYSVSISATSGSLSHSANVTVFVIPRFDFNITTAPIVTFDNGTSTTSIITVRSTTGFTGTVDLTQTISPGSGLTINFNTTTLVLKAQGDTNSSLATFSSSTPGNYLVTITGHNGTSLPVHKAYITVHVANFAISANPSAVTVYEGAPSNSTLSLASMFNFAGGVSLSANVNASGLTATIGNSTLILKTGGTNRTLLTLTGTVVGNYNVTITAVRGSITHKTSILASVKLPDFGISSNPPTVLSLISASNSSLIGLTRLGSFNGTINLSLSPAPTGVTPTLSVTKIFLNSTSKSGVSDLTLAVAGTATPGTYLVTVTGTNTTGLFHQTRVTLIILQPDFAVDWTLRTNGSTVTNNTEVNVGVTYPSQVQIFGKFHFSGTVTLSATILPTGPTAAFNQSSLVVAIGTSPAATLGITPAPGTTPGNYTVTLTATSGSLIHTETLNLVIGDFQIAGQSTLNASVGFNSTAIVSLSSVNHFNGTITISTSTASTMIGSLPNATLVILQVDGSQGVAILVMVANNTLPGTYMVTVTGTSGLSIHPTTITINVVLHDVAITSVSFTSSSSQVGATVTFTISVKNRGTVPENVTVDALAEGFTVGEMNLTGLQPGEARSVTIIWSTNNYAAGSYPLGAKVLAVPNEATTANNVLYSNQSFVLNAPPPPLISPSQITEIAAIAAVIAIIAIAVALVLRRRKPMQTA